MTTFIPRTDILPPAQWQLWPHLTEVTRQGFVLYGGTAIALRLGHRVSVDFDFFHHVPLNRDRLREACPFMASATVLQDQADALTILVPVEGAFVKVSFLAPIRFGRVGHPQYTVDKVLEVAAFEDLMATKLKVIPQRAEAKDYLDIAAMISAGQDLATGLAASSILYGANFQPSESLKALTFYGEGDLEDLPATIKRKLTKAVSTVGDLPDVARVDHRLSSEVRQAGSI